MQHALALNFTYATTDTALTIDYEDLPTGCHTVILDGFRIDRETGEVYGRFVTSAYQPSSEQYKNDTSRPSISPKRHGQSALNETTDNIVFVDFRGANSDTVLPEETVPKKNLRGAGRKPASTANPIAHIAVEVLKNEPGEPHPLWIDDIIFGSCLTAAGQSQNVCNVAMNEVVGALYLHEFKVDVLVAQGTPLRKAQRIIKAARHAAHGIHHYLVRRPKLLQSYEDAAKLEASLAPSNFSHALHASTGGSTAQ